MIRGLALSSLSGVLAALCFPPFDQGWLVWLAPLPVLWALWGQSSLSPRGGARLGYVAGVAFFVLNLKWLRHVTFAGPVLLAPFLALYWALWAAVVARCTQWVLEKARPSTAAHLALAGLTGAAWAGQEWLREVLLSGFGWNGLAVALGDASWLAQAAEWFGVHGLSFFIVFPLAATVLGLRSLVHPPAGTSRRLFPWPAAIAWAITGLVTVGGGWRAQSLGKTASASVSVALIQPNIPQDIKNDPEHLEENARILADLTAAAIADPAPDLLIWPESSLPGSFSLPVIQDFLQQTLDQGPFVFVTGVDEQQLDTFYNCFALAHRDVKNAALYRKVHLVPFGEYLPIRPVFGKIPGLVDLLPADFDSGRELTPLTWPAGAPAAGKVKSVVPLVCFEDTLGRQARQQVVDEPQLMVNVTNDAWFLDSEGAVQHVRNARFRCIELRRPLVRATNTGVTCVVDSLGRIGDSLPRLDRGFLRASVPVPAAPPITLYARVGEAFAILCLAVSFGTAVLARFRSRLPAPAASPGA